MNGQRVLACLVVAMGLLFGGASAGQAADKPADTAVVCPEEFRATLEPWLAFRRAQGHEFAFLSNLKSATEIRAELATLAKAGNLKNVVLIGDAEPNMDRDPTVRKRCVPTFHVPAKVNIQWGSEPLIATDNHYVDFDKPGVPALAIGRLTADSPAELKVILEKTLAYEQSADFGPWRKRVNLIAGVGGFGALADSVLESAAKKFITDGVPASYETTMTYGSLKSPYCPWPADFQKTTQDRLCEGCLFFCYIGHGSRHQLDRIRTPGQSFPILDCADCANLNCTHGAPIALFLACYTGAFDDPKDCLAEELLRAKQGPVAILSGSRVTMPYAMSVMSTEMMDLLFRQKVATIGELFVKAKQNTLHPAERGLNRLLMDGIATVISPQPADLEGERLEHLQLFNLFGDPLLRVRQPQTAKLEPVGRISAGQKLTVTGSCPIDGECELELVCRRDSLRFTPGERPAYQPRDAAQADEYRQTYDAANTGRWVATTTKVTGGKFAATLEVPEKATGSGHLRVFIHNAQDFALGAIDVEIIVPKK